MKKLFTIAVLSIFTMMAIGQDTQEKIMEGRATEFYRVLGLQDRGQYKKFMQENYTKAFLEKPVALNRVVVEAGEEKPSQVKNKSMDKLDQKADMYQQLHDDFGGSKLVSLKRTENKIEMVLKSSSGLMGTFTLSFEKNKPYLMEGLGVQAEMEN
jgi:hypothetical protein